MGRGRGDTVAAGEIPDAGAEKRSGPSAPTDHRTGRWSRLRLASPVLGAVVPPVVAVALLLVVWHYAVQITDARPNILPSPGRVIEKGWEARSDLWENTKPTIQETVIGIAVAFLVACIISTALDFSTRVRRTIYPLLVASQSIPIVVIAPLFIIWFGFGLGPKVIVVVLVTFFPMTVSLVEGYNSSDPDADRLMRSLGANKFQRFVRLRVPSALPFLFTGLRVVSSYAVVAAIFSEAVGARTGLGIYMQVQRNLGRTDLVLAAVVLTVVVSLVLFTITFALQIVAMPWERRRKKQERR